jgi:hypothetical protein
MSALQSQCGSMRETHAAEHATPALTARGAVGAGGARRAGSSACGVRVEAKKGPTVIFKNRCIKPVAVFY